MGKEKKIYTQYNNKGKIALMSMGDDTNLTGATFVVGDGYTEKCSGVYKSNGEEEYFGYCNTHAKGAARPRCMIGKFTTAGEALGIWKTHRATTQHELPRLIKIQYQTNQTIFNVGHLPGAVEVVMEEEEGQDDFAEADGGGGLLLERVTNTEGWTSESPSLSALIPKTISNAGTLMDDQRTFTNFGEENEPYTLSGWIPYYLEKQTEGEEVYRSEGEKEWGRVVIFRKADKWIAVRRILGQEKEDEAANSVKLLAEEIKITDAKGDVPAARGEEEEGRGEEGEQFTTYDDTEKIIGRAMTKKDAEEGKAGWMDEAVPAHDESNIGSEDNARVTGATVTDAGVASTRPAARSDLEQFLGYSYIQTMEVDWSPDADFLGDLPLSPFTFEREEGTYRWVEVKRNPWQFSAVIESGVPFVLSQTLATELPLTAANAAFEMRGKKGILYSNMDLTFHYQFLKKGKMSEKLPVTITVTNGTKLVDHPPRSADKVLDSATPAELIHWEAVLTKSINDNSGTNQSRLYQNILDKIKIVQTSQALTKRRDEMLAFFLDGFNMGVENIGRSYSGIFNVQTGEEDGCGFRKPDSITFIMEKTQTLAGENYIRNRGKYLEKNCALNLLPSPSESDCYEALFPIYKSAGGNEALLKLELGTPRKTTAPESSKSVSLEYTLDSWTPYFIETGRLHNQRGSTQDENKRVIFRKTNPAEDHLWIAVQAADNLAPPAPKKAKKQQKSTNLLAEQIYMTPYKAVSQEGGKHKTKTRKTKQRGQRSSKKRKRISKKHKTKKHRGQKSGKKRKSKNKKHYK